MNKKTRTLILLCLILSALGIIVFVLDTPQRQTQKEEALLKRDLPTFEAKNITNIAITNNPASLNLSKNPDGKWLINGDLKADDAFVEEMLSALTSLSGAERVSSNPEKHSLYGIDEKKGIGVKLTDSSEKAVLNIIIGNEGPAAGTTFLRQDGSDDVLLIAKNLRGAFTQTTDELRDKNIVSLPVEKLQKIIFQQGSLTKLALLKTNSVWSAEGLKSEQVLDPETVQSIILEITHLKASGFPTDKDYNAYGLQTPQSTLTMTFDDGTSFVILFGNTQDQDIYTQVQGEKMVYTIRKAVYEDNVNITLDKILKK